jgi:hypothetical protein
LLSGTVTWAVTGSRFTVTHAGVGSLDFTGTPGPDRVAVSGRLITAGLVSSPAPGTIRITGSRHGPHYTITVGNDGRYTLTVPPGPYTITGRSPTRYGRGVCQADPSATQVLNVPVTVDVYCEEK